MYSEYYFELSEELNNSVEKFKTNVIDNQPQLHFNRIIINIKEYNRWVTLYEDKYNILKDILKVIDKENFVQSVNKSLDDKIVNILRENYNTKENIMKELKRLKTEVNYVLLILGRELWKISFSIINDIDVEDIYTEELNLFIKEMSN